MRVYILLMILCIELIGACTLRGTDGNLLIGKSYAAYTEVLKSEPQQEYTLGAINAISAREVCTLPKGSKVIVRSGGGSFTAGLILANCAYENDLEVVVDYALSAATFITLSAEDPEITVKSIVGFHSPYRMSKEGIVHISLSEYRDLMFSFRIHARRWGYTDESIYTIIGINTMTKPEEIHILSMTELSIIFNLPRW